METTKIFIFFDNGDTRETGQKLDSVASQMGIILFHITESLQRETWKKNERMYKKEKENIYKKKAYILPSVRHFSNASIGF